MIWKVFRFYFFLYLVPCFVILGEQFGPSYGIDLKNVPEQYGYVVTALYIAGCLYLFGVCGNDFFTRSEHVMIFGDKKYSFIWTWILFVPVATSFHLASYGSALIQGVVFLILEILRRRHNKFWDMDEQDRVIQKAKDSKAERVEIDQ